MLQRAAAVEAVLAAADEGDVLVCGLGFLSREVFARVATAPGPSLCCMGSMGSVAPIALGVSLARPNLRVLALEGDGSLLMNLGTLATLRRYGSPRVRLLVFDNGCHESTGGQRSQPPGFALERVCAAVGLRTLVATTAAEVGPFLADPEARVLVLKTSVGGRPPRISQHPQDAASAFTDAIRQRAGDDGIEVART